eukprot:scaffold48005_cov31-Tisochrysis_lutea.AAC.9
MEPTMLHQHIAEIDQRVGVNDDASRLKYARVVLSYAWCREALSSACMPFSRDISASVGRIATRHAAAAEDAAAMAAARRVAASASAADWSAAASDA